MKKHTLYIFLFLLSGLLPSAGRAEGMADSLSSDNVDYRFALGVQVGTDVGGAIPVPFRHIPETFNP